MSVRAPSSKKPSSKKLKPPSKGGGVDYAFREIRERILDLRLKPGAVLEEAVVGAEIGLSRTPVREALTQLASYGLVEITPNRGARVAPLELAEAPELLESLELFQRATNRWAALRRSDSDLQAIKTAHLVFEAAMLRGDKEIMGRTNYDYHAAISRSCGNRYLTDAAGQVELKTARLVHVAYNSVRNEGDMTNYYQLVVEHHEKILRAIYDQNGDAADDLARQHVALFRNRLLAFVGHSQAESFVIQPPKAAPAR